MAMPEAAVNENHSTVFRQHDIRFSRQAFDVQTVAETLGEQGLADDQFRFCVLAPDAGHHPAADFLRNDIGHGQARRASGSPAAAFVSSTNGTISFATASTTGTTTALPNCL